MRIAIDIHEVLYLSWLKLWVAVLCNNAWISIYEINIKEKVGYYPGEIIFAHKSPDRHDRLPYVSSGIAHSSSDTAVTTRLIAANGEDTTTVSPRFVDRFNTHPSVWERPVMQERGACLVLPAGLLRSTELLLWLSSYSSSVQRHRCVMCFIT